MYTASTARLASILAGQYDVIAFRQVIDAGCDPELPQREVAAGRWQRPHRGVYVRGTDELTLMQRAWCAKLVGGKDVVISGPLACHLLGIPDAPSRTAVGIVPSGCHRRGNGDYLLRRSARPPRSRCLDGVPVARPVRAVVDACRVAPGLREVRALVCGAIRAKHTSHDDLIAEQQAEPHSGLGLLRRALEDWADGARSAPEAEVADALRDEARRRRMPPFLLNPNVYDGAVLLGAADVYVPGYALGGETDSRRHHGSVDALDATLTRHAAFTAAGVHLEHVTPSRFRQNPAAWAALFAAIAAQREGLGDPPGLRIEPVGPLQPVPGRRRPRKSTRPYSVSAPQQAD